MVVCPRWASRCAGAGVTCGLVPVVVALRTNVNDALKQGGRSGALAGGRSQDEFGSGNVAEIGFTTSVLLTASGLLLRSFRKKCTEAEPEAPARSTHWSPPIVCLKKNMEHRQPWMHSTKRFYIACGPYRHNKSGIDFIPFLSTAATREDSIAEGYSIIPQPMGIHTIFATQSDVSSDYFDAAGIPLILGRLFTEADNAGSQLQWS